MSCLLSLSNLFGSFSNSISNFLSYVLTGSKGEETSSVRLFYGVMAILCFECSTTVIKFKLIIRNRLWNTVAVTQDSFQNSRLGKISVSFRVKEKYKHCSFFWRCICFVCKWAYEMLMTSDYLVHNHLQLLLSQTQSILHFPKKIC